MLNGFDIDRQPDRLTLEYSENQVNFNYWKRCKEFFGDDDEVNGGGCLLICLLFGFPLFYSFPGLLLLLLLLPISSDLVVRFSQDKQPLQASLMFDRAAHRVIYKKADRQRLVESQVYDLAVVADVDAEFRDVLVRKATDKRLEQRQTRGNLLLRLKNGQLQHFLPHHALGEAQTQAAQHACREFVGEAANGDPYDRGESLGLTDR